MPGGLSAALKRIAQTPFRTLIPGHGAPMTPVQFGIYHTAFDALITCSASTRAEAECAAGWTAINHLAIPSEGPAHP
jgi:hypothetical protein